MPWILSQEKQKMSSLQHCCKKNMTKEVTSQGMEQQNIGVWDKFSSFLSKKIIERSLAWQF